MKILVLDDEQEIIESLKGMLAGRHMVEGATDAEIAIEMVRTQEYDFVLLDYRMPGHDGMWFMRHARLPRKAKALLMTGFLNKEVLQQMFKLGISGYLVKPIDKDDILRHLEFHSRSQG